MDHKHFKPPPMSANECMNSQRARRRRAHSFSSSLLESICQSMDQDDHHSSRRFQHNDDVHSNKVVSTQTHSHLNQHHKSHVKVSKQNRTKTSAPYAEIVVLQVGQVTKSEKPINRVHAPSFSSSSVVSNFSYSDTSSTHGPLSSSVSSYGTGSADSSCFSTCSSKSPTSSFKEKITKAKLRAIKLYTELKTPKKTKPISPRCRLATYLNTLFTPKKQNKTEQSAVTPPKETSTKPNATSITRPKTKPLPPSASESRGAMHNDRKTATTMRTMMMMRHDDLDQAKGREIFKKCQEKIVKGLKIREFVEELGGDIDDDDDAESYASSDLFELDFLMERGGEELPVFETTDFKINQAIANGFSL